MLVKEFEGRSNEDALEKALKSLNLDRSQIKKVEYLGVKSSFFGLTGKKFKIKVFYENEGKAIIALARSLVQGLLNHLNLGCKVDSVKEEKSVILIQIASLYQNSSYNKKYGECLGNSLEAIQIWLNSALYNQVQKKDYKKIIVNYDSYSSTTKPETIKKLAYEAVDFVRANKRSKLLPEMNSFERRLVYLTLQNVNDIVTKSEGNWPNRKVRVSLKKKRY